MASYVHCQEPRDTHMSSLTTKEGAKIFYND